MVLSVQVEYVEVIYICIHYGVSSEKKTDDLKTYVK